MRLNHNSHSNKQPVGLDGGAHDTCSSMYVSRAWRLKGGSVLFMRPGRVLLAMWMC